ncbi:hypothetical protein GCM10007183_07950 [Staphylococcus muscae]|uniref:Uncharacterized protein n=1 Tax=Staphylococcus muscae TaxID=1294 RepID=A0ABQ1HRK4_9STAP|nr:hypothetical protein GCM10007183_07950 [Staphylococcus muscae]
MPSSKYMKSEIVEYLSNKKLASKSEIKNAMSLPKIILLNLLQNKKENE